MSSFLVSKIRPGIFGKFFILMIATGVAISSLLGVYWRHVAQPRFKGDFHNHIGYYTRLIAQELGNPPDTEKARNIAARLRIGVRFENPAEGESWQTELFPPKFQEKEVNHPHRGQLLTAISIPSGRLLFWFRIRGEIETIHAIAMAAIVAVVIFIAWLISRFLLSPIRRLRAGMAAIEAGRLDYRLEARGDDELAGLERSFNSMTQNLETMLRDRDRLLADVSHELRSPITRLKVALEFNKDKKTAKMLRGEIAQMQAIITALLDTERLAAGSNLETISVEDIVAATCREHKIRFIRNGIQTAVKGSAEKLKIAIRNVAENALKHGKQPVTIELTEQPGFIIIRVTDAGPGIADAEKEKIFQPFYRGNGAAKRGYGLGLYMTQRIVESMCGKISIAPSPRGTAVEIRLPLGSGS